MDLSTKKFAQKMTGTLGTEGSGLFSAVLYVESKEFFKTLRSTKSKSCVQLNIAPISNSDFHLISKMQARLR